MVSIIIEYLYPMTAYNRAVLFTILVMLIWASSFTVTKIVVADVPPVYFAFLRFAVASVSLLLLVLLQRRKFVNRPRPPLGSMIWMGLSGVTFYYIFFNLAMQYTSAATGALLQGLIPIIIAVLATIFLKESLSRQQIAGILISVAGVTVIGFIEAPATASRNPVLGSALMMVCIIAWSVYTILSKKVASFDPTLVVTYVSVAGTIFLIPAVLIEAVDHPFSVPSFQSWMAIAYLGVFASAVSYLLYNYSLQYLSAAQVGNFLNLDPVLGAVIAIIFLHDRISLLQIGGCILVVIGIWLSGSKGH